jgi:hypothetical protein
MINLIRRYVFAFYVFRNGWSSVKCLKMFEFPHQSNGAIQLIGTRTKIPTIKAFRYPKP